MLPWANDHNVAHLLTKTVPMNLIWSESAQWLWRSSVRKIPGALITPMDTPIMPPWSNYHDVAHLQAKTVPIIFILDWIGLVSSGVRKIPEARITDSRSLYYAHGHVHVAPMGKRPRGWGSSNELDLEWIGPVVAELWAGRTDEQTDGRMDGDHSIILLFPSERAGDKKDFTVMVVT